MTMPDCPCRRTVQGAGDTSIFFCAHPRVHVLDDLVTPEICRICRVRLEPLPEQLRQPPEQEEDFRRRAGWTLKPPTWRRGYRGPRGAAVVIPCRNYGQYLDQAIDSVLAQTRPPAEILVVDDGSTDHTRQAAGRYASRGVRYLYVEHHNSHEARREGFEATRAEVLCFLDADDMLAPDYLQQGLAQFVEYRVGLVYSDKAEIAGELKPAVFPELHDRSLLERQNYLHTGSLVRREALAISGALHRAACDRTGPADWLLWRRVLADGWLARKQAGLYYYRRHGDSLSQRRRRQRSGYFQHASLDKETVTLFIPLSGRTAQWTRLAQYLDRQSWPHDQTKLVLLDTSQNAEFSAGVRRWMLSCDYPDVRHARHAVGQAGLADQPRREVQEAVSLAMARIYNRMARELTTDYVWALEDDVSAPDDACRRLLEGFDERTGSVSAAYWSRFANGYVAWDRRQRRIAVKGRGLQTVGGNGFGCVVLRGGLARETVFTATLDWPAYDTAFYWRLQRAALAAKVDWSLECQHLE